MKNWKEIHEHEARKERRELLDDAVPSMEKFALGAKEKRFPPGSIWKWSLSSVFGPIGSADKQEKAA